MAVSNTAFQGSWAAPLALILSRAENDCILQNQMEKIKITTLPHCSSYGLYKQEEINTEYKCAKRITVDRAFQTSAI